MSTVRSHPAAAAAAKKRRRAGGQDAVVMKRTFCLWVLIGSCLFMLVHQVQLTKRAVLQSKSTKEPTSSYFLPDISSFLFDDTDNDSSADDVFADDDNAHRYDDDDDDEFQSGEEDDFFNNGQTQEEGEEQGEEEEDDSSNEPTSGVEVYVKQLRKQMDETALQSGGKVSANAYMEMYQKAMQRRKQSAESKQYRPYAGSSAIKDNNGDLSREHVRKARDMERKTRRRNSYRTRSDWRPPIQDFTKMPPLPMENRILPNMKAIGGVIFFLHVPKTGGQTVRQFNLRFRMHIERKSIQANRRQQRKTNGGAKLQIGLKIGEDGPEPPSRELMELDMLSKERLRFVVANTLDVFHAEAVPQVNHYLEHQSNSHGKILFVEVHGMDNYHALELEPYLQHWRQQSQKSGVPFFAFTLLREAISMHVSFFNYYYIHPGDPRFCKNPLKPQQKCSGSGYGMSRRQDRHQRRDEAKAQYAKMRGMSDARMRGGDKAELEGLSYRDFMKSAYTDRRKTKMVNHADGIKGVSHEDMEKAMLQVAYDNPQCLFLARGERAFGDGTEEKLIRDVELRRLECQQTYLSLQRTMDWIGRTDTLSTETLPMLTHIMFQRPELGKHLPKANVSPPSGFVKLSQLQASTVKGLEKVSQFDQEIYYRIKEDYTMDQWVNKTDYQ
ncbi:expressed unknown protein [Seminavis robusta]|uniref:Uncharacterized protein n=1 Tax=Seminavis robusta TaxID=568900 RepID=A0A9N8EBP8_9STRA|nr:expressed unknown protein [Seminavis robusta]|eukprot:Sro717_g192080.1 n/a (667) ;mRNA; r:41693-43693